MILQYRTVRPRRILTTRLRIIILIRKNRNDIQDRKHSNRKQKVPGIEVNE